MSWLDQFFFGYQTIQIAGISVPSERTLNFVTGVTAQDDPLNSRTNLYISGGGTPAFLPQIITGNNPTVPVVGTINNFGDLEANTYAGPISVYTPVPISGTSTFRLRDVGGAVATYTITLTDRNATPGYLIQNPIDGGFYNTITFGPGSGGGANPNLPAYTSVTFTLTSNTIVSRPFWQVAT